MKTELEKNFIRAMRRKQLMVSDELIGLRPRQYASSVWQLTGAKSLIFDIIENESGRVAGEIALRIGESSEMFYLGHIGYHIDPPYRGKHEALRACRLVVPMMEALGLHTFVITTDVDNLPSIRTCEKLGCVLESTVDVPKWCMDEFDLSARKRRYVYGAAAFSS